MLQPEYLEEEALFELAIEKEGKQQTHPSGKVAYGSESARKMVVVATSRRNITGDISMTGSRNVTLSRGDRFLRIPDAQHATASLSEHQ